MILAAVLAAPAVAQPLPGAVKVSFANIFGWWLPVAAPHPRPAVIALHGCDGLVLRNPLNARERSMAELLGRREFHVLLSDRCRGTDIHGALDWLAAHPEVDRNRIVVLGWSEGGSALLAALKHRIGPMPLQARAAIAFSPACGPYAVTPGSYLPVAPLLILVGTLEEGARAAPCLELANWTPKVVVRVLPESGDGIEAMLEFLEQELR
jgi:poly(3-hydroxybutyrate) depolymerase